jgi:TP901-1 family phage major tail protein
MAAQKGSLVLIKADVSGTQTTIGGLRSSSITLNDELVDVTTKDSSGNRELLPQGGNVSVTISGSGIFTDAASENSVRGYFATGTLKTYSFIVPDLGTYSGTFQISSLEYAGEFNGEVTYSITLESSGTVSFSAA